MNDKLLQVNANDDDTPPWIHRVEEEEEELPFGTWDDTEEDSNLFDEMDYLYIDNRSIQ